MKFHEWSKRVGWESPVTDNYPTETMIAEALENNDMELFLRWKRFLTSPANDEQRALMKQIVYGFEKVAEKLDI